MNARDDLIGGDLYQIAQRPDALPVLPDAHEPDKDPIYKLLFRDGLHTFAVLDAAIVPNLPEMLETSGLKHSCLFTGEAAEDYGAAAPWLVELIPGNEFTCNLLTDSPTPAPWHLWGYEPGIFVQGAAPFEAMKQHLRKFTRVQDETGAWFMMRFWATDFLFLTLRQHNAAETPFLRSLFRPGIIASVIGHNVFDEMLEVVVLPQDRPQRPPPPGICRKDVDALGVDLANRRSARAFARDYPAVLNDVPMREIRDRIHHARATAAGIGVDGEGLVGTFILFGVVFAPKFWEDPGFLAYWNDSRLQPNDRFKAYLDAVKAHAGASVPDFAAWW